MKITLKELYLTDLVMVVNGRPSKHASCIKSLIKILQGSVVTQNMLDGLTIYPPVLLLICGSVCVTKIKVDWQ